MEKMMYLPEPVKAKILEFVNKYPFPKTNDEDAANWTHKLCEQLKFSFPNDGWGHKSAGSGRPHSADVIVLVNPFWGWDIISSAGSPDAKLNLTGESIDLQGGLGYNQQIYEPVIAHNYLSEEPPIPLPPDGIEEKLNLIIMMLHQQMEAIVAPRVTRIG
jgi:hypothetical protein